MCQGKGKATQKWEGGGAFANGSEVCRLKSVDNHGLALPSPSSVLLCGPFLNLPFFVHTHGTVGGVDVRPWF